MARLGPPSWRDCFVAVARRSRGALALGAAAAMLATGAGCAHEAGTRGTAAITIAVDGPQPTQVTGAPSLVQTEDAVTVRVADVVNWLLAMMPRTAVAHTADREVGMERGQAGLPARSWVLQPPCLAPPEPLSFGLSTGLCLDV